ncbi:hypothetical protein [Methylorubrum salsuginis]|uniref:Antitoxin ParD1/3/4 n=1 Tax=Methylorubrum salsuginis TaxID=414703 RepID=A0A1I4D3Y7_9HYPH|nr:hypothetical protein [Methylorubrum salsuginis]SFK88434.1 hypothetical protein SAMN04488125_105176 [Methylorubrum salsuginis]
MSEPVVLMEHAAFDDLGAAERDPSTDALAALRAIWAEGVASGDHRPVDDVLDVLAARYDAMQMKAP